MSELTSTESAIVAIIKNLKEERGNNRIPTASLYEQLYNHGVEAGYRPYGSKLKSIDKTSSEWLYDFSWWKIREGTHPQYIEHLELVLESEANDQIEVLRDFRKLVQARAAHRVMVFQTSIASTMSKAYEIVHTFEGSEHGDRYLFVEFGSSVRTGLMVFPDEPEEL